MKQLLSRVFFAGVFTGCAVSGAHADSIRIVAGSLIWSATTDNSDGSSADVRLQGEQGFTFEGFTGNGVFGPSQCISPECGTGSVVDLLARWGGGDLEGIATLKGQTYTDLGSASGFEGMLAEWTGQLTIPSGFA